MTDADLLLGKLDAGYFLGGDMPLDQDAATAAAGKLAEGLASTPEDVAWGVEQLVDQNMAAAARMHAVERGADLRGVSLIAFGGAGPLHACGVAELLEARRVIFPPYASVLSAFGTLVTPVRIDLARSYVKTLASVGAQEREALLSEMRDEGRRVLGAAGVSPGEVIFRYGVDARYQGQGNELTVWLGEGDTFPVSDDEVVARFSADYATVYGMTIPDVAIEVVTWRVSTLAPAPHLELSRLAPGGPPVAKSERLVRFDKGAPPVRTPVYDRVALGANAVLEGPAIVEERETTCVLRPGWHAEMGSDGSLIAIPPARGRI